jgi:adenylate cyclase
LADIAEATFVIQATRSAAAAFEPKGCQLRNAGAIRQYPIWIRRMAENEQTNRRLAAILAADVAGYSRMMAADEAGTLAALKHHRKMIFDPAVTRHRGRLVKLIGDGALVEFASVVDAVNCALAIQRSIKTQASSDGRGIVLRIGINLGDVIIDGEDIYGDGVNVAARLEPLADPGGICVSGVVNESVGNRVDVSFTDGGEVTVKNVARPIRIWKWHPNGDTVSAKPLARPGSREGADPEPPSIAVLPFNNMSGDAEQEYFSDGITEDIITDLSKIADLLVIARNSSFAYKGKNPDMRVVGRELGVRSVLEGSIRRAGNRVRITAQLINAANGAHLWAERYDRDLTDIFAVQDDVTRCIVEALKVKLTPAEAVNIADTPTRNFEAHDRFLRGRELLRGTKWNREIFEQAMALFTRAIELDPNYAEAYAGLAMMHNMDFQNKWTGATNALDDAARLAAIAIEKGPSVPFAHWITAIIALWKKDLDRTKRECETTLALSPSYAPAYGTLGFAETYSGNPEAALAAIEQALRLDPVLAHHYLHVQGSAYLAAGKYEAAVASFRERIRLMPGTDLSRGLMVSALGHLGEIDEARRVWAELKALNAKYSYADHLARLPFANPADAERIKEGFEKAGLSD